MDVSCPACASKYTADDDKLRGKTARMRCRACDTVWLVSGPEDAMEEKRAAVVKRGADREKRDLFASQPLEMGSVKQTLRPPPPSAVAGTAARNESSVLFTLDGLVKGNGARVKTPEPEVAPSYAPPSDDEGIIDLKALASSPPKAAARPVAALFPSDAPPSAFARDASGSSFPADSTGSFPRYKKIGAIAAGAVALVASVIGISVAFRGEDPTPRAAAATVVNTPAPPPAVAAPPATKTEAAPPTVSSSSDDDDKSTTSKGKVRKGKGKAAKAGAYSWKKGDSTSSSSGTENMSKPAKPAAAPAAADPCHCKGDFACILRCTAKGK
jgi:predicted Zn finger-like uncharacterized protein